MLTKCQSCFVLFKNQFFYFFLYFSGEICKADPTVVEHYLSGDIAKSVIDMGYNRSSVSQVITDRIKQFGE